MNLIERAKNILIQPQKEWDAVNSEQPDIAGILMGYVLPLAGLAAVASFIGYGVIGFNYGFMKLSGTSWGLYYAVTVLVSAFAGVLVSAFVIDALAPSFGSEKNLGRSVQLVAYSYTASWVGGLLSVLPVLAIVGSLAGIYGLYILYLGFPKLKKTPADKHVSYFIVSIITIIVVYVVIGFILSRILLSVLGLSFGLGDIKISM